MPANQKTPPTVEASPRSQALWWLLAAIAVFAVLRTAIDTSAERLAYSAFRIAVDEGNVVEAWIGDEVIRGSMKSDGGNRPFETTRVDDPSLFASLREHGVVVHGMADAGLVSVVTMWLLPVFLVLFVLLPWLRRSGGPSAVLNGMGRTRARLYQESASTVHFSDVAGAAEAKAELTELITFLKSPERFVAMGARIPKGVLLVGPPGTGKTLLARAVAGEAGVPFFTASGSEFVEMLVGVGAARVRDLFMQAKQHTPSIIFIDEIDALGRARGSGMGTHEEREQTLNQLLFELDGFDPGIGVVLLAATNRPEILDPALLRPGRFDRHIPVGLPDRLERTAILKVHVRRVPLDASVDLDSLAALCVGASGADLANLVNEAALGALRRGHARVQTTDFDDALERVLAGPRRSSQALSPRDRFRVACHETGHTIVSFVLSHGLAPQKVSIIPHGAGALGFTIKRVDEDRVLKSRDELEAEIAVLLAGRAAELILCGGPSTGGQDDLRRANELAVRMVTQWGMGPSLAQRPLETIEPRSRSRDDRAADESEAILRAQHERAMAIITAHRERARQMADTLVAREVLSGSDVKAILSAAPAVVTEERQAA